MCSPNSQWGRTSAGSFGESQHRCMSPIPTAEGWVFGLDHQAIGNRLRISVEERKVRHRIGCHASDPGTEQRCLPVPGRSTLEDVLEYLGQHDRF